MKILSLTFNQREKKNNDYGGMDTSVYEVFVR